MARSGAQRHIASRILVLLVFASNMYCAISFFTHPSDFVGAYQLSGEGAQAAIAGMGVVFAMWSLTYVPIIVLPNRFRPFFVVAICQQLLGLAGEGFLYAGLGEPQAILAASIMRFIIFDALGLVMLAIAFVLARN